MTSVEFVIADCVARITLNRPERMNAFTAQMHAELGAALATVLRDEAVRALVITGAGRAFCTGQDLSERRVPAAAAPVDLGRSIDDHYGPLVLKLRALPIPVIAALNGVAAGAGIALALSCDLVIAARSARFVSGFERLGVIPDAGGSWLLQRALGPARAMAFAMLGGTIEAEDAARLGLIWRCVDDAAVPAAVDEALARVRSASRAALRAAKVAMQASAASGFEQQLRLERELMQLLGAGADYREGVQAFFDRRAPHFA
jgi:2-(1,2-epoxy-1,2-dihydrophenyl)acetyl-CoA isomerase